MHKNSSSFRPRGHSGHRTSGRWHRPDRNIQTAGAGQITEKARSSAHQEIKPQSVAGPAPDSVPPVGAFTLLSPELQRSVSEEGYVTPTPIQEKAIPVLLEGRDFLGCAQTGTGKTAAFVLPILQRLAGSPRQHGNTRPRALILAPTRELAAQIGDSLYAYGRHMRITHIAIFGGVGHGPQINAFRRGVDIIVATPGRLLDHVSQRNVRLDGIEIFVLDEADRMLDMGFIPDVRRILALLPGRRQTLFFSATLGRDILDLAKDMVRDPVHVTIDPGTPAVERITQKVMFVERGDKSNLLTLLLSNPAIKRVLVFAQMKHVANRVSDHLFAKGIPATAIHGNKSQTARTKALDDFKRGRLRVLVATDIAARGIDVDNISHVFNYDLPVEPETYVHRIGRTARAGATGDAISFCSPREREGLRDIERLIGFSIPADENHPFHSEIARRATGSEARPLPRQGGGRGGHDRHGGHDHHRHHARPAGRSYRGKASRHK